MNCWNHEEKPAVATCVVCKKNYCKACFGIVGETESPVCPKCVNEGAKEYLANLVTHKKKNKTFLTISIIAYVIGMIIFMLSYSGSDTGVIITALALMGIPAVPMALRFSCWVDDNNPERYVTDGNTIRKGVNNIGCGTQIILALVVVSLGIVITPILMIITGCRINTATKNIIEQQSRVYSDKELREVLSDLA